VYLSDHVTVRGNTCYWNNTDSGPHSGGTWRGELNNSMSSDNLWENNIAIANPAFNKENTAIVIAALKGYSSTGIVFKNNLTFNGTPGQPSVRVDLGNWPAPELVKTSDGNRLGVDPKIPRPNVSLNFKGISASPTRSSSTPGQQGQK
jgi:serralysin